MTKAPHVKLVQMDLTGAWPDALHQRSDRIVANVVLHEFDLGTKIRLLQRLATHHLVETGLIVVGDVAFATAAAGQQSGAESWDEEEHTGPPTFRRRPSMKTNLEVVLKQISCFDVIPLLSGREDQVAVWPAVIEHYAIKRSQPNSAGAVNA